MGSSLDEKYSAVRDERDKVKILTIEVPEMLLVALKFIYISSGSRSDETNYSQWCCRSTS